MSFREQAIADLETFLSVDEFAERRALDGAAPVACILEAEERRAADAEGVYASVSVLHVRATDYAIPAIGQRVEVDGRPANVLHVDEAMGMLSVRLGWYES